MKGTFPIDKFQETQTPFYYYDTTLLRQTLRTICEEAGKHPGFEVHYAVKANANPKVLGIISQAGLGADCVSGGEMPALEKATGKSILDWRKTSFASTWRAYPNWKSSTSWLPKRTR